MSIQNYVCPNCQGRGCPVCQNTGQIALTNQEVAELQKLAYNQPQTQLFDNFTPPSQIHEERKLRGQIAGILTLVFLAAISISGFVSWFYTKTLRPFLQFWAVIAVIVVYRPVSSLGFFREEKVHDFIESVQEEGIKIKLPPLFPLV
jgi:hypothetical protein